MRVICQIVRLDEYFISLHCIMFIWAYLDSWIFVARVIHNVSSCFLTELALLSFFHVWCVHPMRLMSTCVLIYAISSLQRCMPFIFVINVVTSTSMQTRHRDAADFSPCSVVILMPCKLDATERSMLILWYFSKDVLNIWLCSIHSCPCLQFCDALACILLALFLL